MSWKKEIPTVVGNSVASWRLARIFHSKFAWNIV